MLHRRQSPKPGRAVKRISGWLYMCNIYPLPVFRWTTIAKYRYAVRVVSGEMAEFSRIGLAPRAEEREGYSWGP